MSTVGAAGDLPQVSIENRDLLDYLLANVDGLQGIDSIRQFNQGQSNPTYLVQAKTGRYVLRAQPPGKLLKGAHQVDREFRVMQALADTAVPVPSVHVCSDENGVLGRRFFVMSFVDGQIHWDPALPALNPQDRNSLYQSMCRTLAAIHSVDPVQIGLEDFGRTGNYFDRQIALWSRQYAASATQSIANMQVLYDWLLDNPIEDDGQVSLVHGDFRLDNLMFNDAHEVVAVLDWELSTLGHPLADLAYQCMQWRLANQGLFRGLAGVARGDSGIPDEASYLRWYCDNRGIAAIENWPYYLVFSFYRLASILQGVYKRSLDGNASNTETARQYGELVPVLAALGVAATE